MLSGRVGEGRACWSLGNAYVSMGSPAQALTFAKKHLQISQEVSPGRPVPGLPSCPQLDGGPGDAAVELGSGQRARTGMWACPWAASAPAQVQGTALWGRGPVQEWPAWGSLKVLLPSAEQGCWGIWAGSAAVGMQGPPPGCMVRPGSSGPRP